MTVLNLQIVAGDDDGYETDSGSSFQAGATTIRTVANATDSSRINGFTRFTGVTIEQGDTIDSAFTSWFIISTLFDDILSDIRCEDVDDSVDLAANADITDRARTAASVLWDATGVGTGFEASPDLKAAIQEVIDRPGWSSGNALSLLVDGRTTASRECRGRSFEGNSSEAAKLDITFTAAGAGGLVAGSLVLLGVGI